MSDIITKFEEKFKVIVEGVDKASESIKIEKLNQLRQQYKLAVRSLEKEREEKLRFVELEHEKNVKILSSNKDKVKEDEYEDYIKVLDTMYEKKQKEINDIYEKDVESENDKFSVAKQKEENELEQSKVNLRKKKFDELREKEVNSLVQELDDLTKNYNKEKEALEEKYKAETKKVKEEFSKDGIDQLECIYFPPEQRVETAKKVYQRILSGYLPVELIDDKEILIGDEIGRRKVSDEKSNAEYKTESDFRKINEEKFSNIKDAIKHIKALKFEEIEQKILNDEKEKNDKDDFDSQDIDVI